MHSDTLTLERRRKVAKTSKTSSYNIYRIASLIYAILFFVFPIVTLAIIYYVYTNSRIYANVSSSDTIRLPCLLSIVSLIFTVVAPFVGIFGYVKQSPKLIKVFGILATCYIISQICIACIIFVYRGMDLNLPIMRENLKRIFQDDVYKKNMNIIQTRYSCCGVDGPQDYQLYVRGYECLTSPAEFSCKLPQGCCYGRDPLKACTVTNRSAMRKALEVQREITDKASIYKNKLWASFLRNYEISNRPCAVHIGHAMDKQLFNLGLVLVCICLVNIIGMFFVVMLLVKMGDRKNLYHYKDRSMTPML